MDNSTATAVLVICSVIVIAVVLIIGCFLIKRDEVIYRAIQKSFLDGFSDGYHRGYAEGSEFFNTLTAHKTINQVREFAGLEPIKDEDFTEEFKPKEKKSDEEKD